MTHIDSTFQRCLLHDVAKLVRAYAAKVAGSSRNLQQPLCNPDTVLGCPSRQVLCILAVRKLLRRNSSEQVQRRL